MLFIKAFHLIALVAWFAGLFYLPRLFVYHSQAQDKISLERFVIMEKRLYYAITWPAGLMTTGFGFWLLGHYMTYHLHSSWMHMKITLVGLLWFYHLTCGHYLKQLSQGTNKKTTGFYRVFNEIPTVLLIAIVLLVELKP